MFLSPAKNIECNVTAVSGLGAWPYHDGSNDPYWSGGATPKDYRWAASLTVSPQSHSDGNTPTPYVYNGSDIAVGMWLASLVDGISLRIVQINSATDTLVECVLEDTYRYNTFGSVGGIGVGIFQTPAAAMIFEVNESFKPILSSPPSSGFGTTFLSSIISRCNKMDSTVHIFLGSNGFKVGQIIGSKSGVFLANPPSDAVLLGYVAAVFDPGNFLLKPINETHILDYLPGMIGQEIYLDDVGNYTTSTITGTLIGVKIANNGQTWINGGTINPTIQQGMAMSINGYVITAPTAIMGDWVNAVNLATTIHATTAAMVPVETGAQTVSVDLAYGSVGFVLTGDVYPTFRINGYLLSSVTCAAGLATYNSQIATAIDIALDINNAGVPNIVADGSDGVLTISNTSGGPINIDNVSADANGTVFAGPNSATGLPLSSASSSNVFFQLVAQDARRVVLKDVSGSPLESLGIQSAESGEKALLLFAAETGSGGSAGTHVKAQISESVSPTLVGIITGTIQQIKVVITSPFTALISVGTSTNSSDLVSTDQILETRNGIYIIDVYREYSEQPIYVYLFGGSTNTGQATISIETDKE